MESRKKNITSACVDCTSNATVCACSLFSAGCVQIAGTPDGRKTCGGGIVGSGIGGALGWFGAEAINPTILVGTKVLSLLAGGLGFGLFGCAICCCATCLCATRKSTSEKASLLNQEASDVGAVPTQKIMTK